MDQPFQFHRLRRQGDLAPSVSPRDEARFFTASVLGRFAMLRAKAPGPVTEGAARVASAHLETIRSAARPPARLADFIAGGVSDQYSLAAMLYHVPGAEG